MDTNRIRYFLSLAQTGSLTKAAELHHISPAAFSKAMKIFESEVGEKLILPHGRGLILTDYAKSLVPELSEVISKLNSISQKKHKTDEKRLRIATFEVFSTYFMSKAVKEQFKDYACEILESVPGKMEEAVVSGKADLGLTYLPIPHPDLDFLKVQAIEMGLFGKENAPFVVPVSPVEGSPNKVKGLDGWPDNNFPRDIQFEVTLMESALGLCREGLAVAYLPKFVVKLHNQIAKPSYQLKELELPKNFKKNKDYVYLIKRKSDKEGTEAKKLAQVVRKVVTM